MILYIKSSFFSVYLETYVLLLLSVLPWLHAFVYACFWVSSGGLTDRDGVAHRRCKERRYHSRPQHCMKGWGGYLKLLVATPASGISADNTSSGCQAFSSHHTWAVTIKLRISAGAKQVWAVFMRSFFFGRLLRFWSIWTFFFSFNFSTWRGTGEFSWDLWEDRMI